MKRLGIPALCVWVILGIFCEPGAAQEPFTPSPGSPERRAVLDAVRDAIKGFPQQHNPGFQYLRDDARVVYEEPIRFFVDWMKLHESWGWLEVHGQNYGLRLCALLRKDAGSWKVAALIRPDVVACTEGLDLCLDLNAWIYAKMRHTFPQASAKIFPEVSEARRGVLEALRRSMAPTPETVFWVRHFGVEKDWAWIETDPRTADGRGIFEPIDSLLQRVQGAWVVREVRPCCGDCADDPDCADITRYYRKLKQRFPEAPPDIFPASRPH